jgi:hypothetical protein
MKSLRRVASVVVMIGLFAGAEVSSSSAATSLSQTSVEPSFGAPLTAMMRQLFSAISANSPGPAMSLFFPRGAYVFMKTGLIPNPSADYEHRLIAFFNLDIGAYHQLLTGRPRTTFVRVNANPRLATWIGPGTCENRVGYWHVPGVRLVVRRDNRTVSVAVDSLISWRGVWYVVHLGPNPRPQYIGTVDRFAPGPGVPGPAGGC